MRYLVALVVVASSCLGGCGTNPVTGKTEIQFISEPQEIALGVQNYLPARQMQGGEYVLDDSLSAFVSDVGQRLAAVSDRPDLPYEFVVLNNSVPNAWALPGGKIALNRGLLMELNSEAELAAVIGHEIVHAAARHGAKSVERGTLLQGALLALQLSTRDNDYANLIVGGAQVGAMLLSTRYGRQAELESDHYGMRYMTAAGYDPDAAVDLQETFVRLSKNRKSNWLSGLFASHPPSQARVERNRETAAQLPDGGDYGRERYAAAMSGLRASAPAYKKYDEAIEAANDKRFDQARALAGEALALEPREAKFHGLLGDLAARRKNYRAALEHYQGAVDRNPRFFQHYLGRGLVHNELGELRFAEEDLQRSIDLLPTATAHYTLGSIAERTGRTDEARRHYAMASQSDSGVGRAAALSLVRIDLPQNPGHYVQTRLQLDQRGMIGLAVGNSSPVALRNVEIVIAILDPSGTRIEGTRPLQISRTLNPGQQVVVATGLGPVSDPQQLARVRAEVRGASVAD